MIYDLLFCAEHFKVNVVCVSVAEGEGIITLEEGFCEAVTEMAFAAQWPAGFVCEVP